MPRQNSAQKIGRLGERWFPQQLPANWLWQPPLEDIGIDGVVVICDDTPSNGLEFRVQVKSSKRWLIQNERIVVRVKRESVLYWLSGFTPTLLVLYETTSNTGWYAWVNQIFAEDLSVIAGNEKTVALHVPETHRLDASVWVPLSRHLHSVNLRIAKRIATAGAAIPILKATHWLMQSLHLIDLCANGRRGESERVPLSDLVRAEMTAHREIVLALFELGDELRNAGVSIDGVGASARRYLNDCARFIVDFPGFVKHSGPGFTTEVNLPEMAAFRPEATRAVTQIVGKLSQLSLEVARERATSQGGDHYDPETSNPAS